MSENNGKRNDAPPRRDVPAWQSALFSLIVPGSGQFLLGERGRGVGFLITIVVLGILIAWQGAIALVAPLVAIWLWGVYDAFRLVRP